LRTRGADVAERGEREANDVLVLVVVEVHLEAVGYQHEHLVAFVEQDHQAEVADALRGKGVGGGAGGVRG
jgi:hypothetical protein